MGAVFARRNRGLSSAAAAASTSACVSLVWVRPSESTVCTERTERPRDFSWDLLHALQSFLEASFLMIAVMALMAASSPFEVAISNLRSKCESLSCGEFCLHHCSLFATAAILASTISRVRSLKWYPSDRSLRYRFLGSRMGESM